MHWEKLGRTSGQIWIQCPEVGETTLTALSPDTQVLTDHLVLLGSFCSSAVSYFPSASRYKRSEMLLSRDCLVLMCSSLVLL